MRRDDLVIWLLMAALLAGILLTILFAPRRSRHGYGALHPHPPFLTYAKSLGYSYR